MIVRRDMTIWCRKRSTECSSPSVSRNLCFSCKFCCAVATCSLRSLTLFRKIIWYLRAELIEVIVFLSQFLPRTTVWFLRVLKTKDLSCVRFMMKSVSGWLGVGVLTSGERTRSSKSLLYLVGEIAWEGG